MKWDFKMVVLNSGVILILGWS